MKIQHQILKIALAFTLAILATSPIFAQTSKNNDTGLWADGTTWTSDIAPDSVLTNGIKINIDGYVTQIGDVTVIGNSTGGLLTINDTLWITGNLTIKEKGTVRITSTGVLIIEGNANFNDKSQLVNDGQVVVKGNLTVTDKSDLVNTSDAFYVYGTVTDAAQKSIDTVQNEQDLANDDLTLLELVNGNSPLPVELLYFEAEAEAAHEQVYLRWATAMEDNFDFFTIERAGDDMNFQPIATLQGSGFGSQIVKYTFTDEKPLTGMNFYRLKATDLDGMVEYHKIIQAWIEQQHADVDISLYPNPVQDNSQLFISTNSNATEEITISDFFGNIVVKTFISKGENQIALPSNLKPGTYLVSITHTDGSKHHIRLLKN